MSNTDTETTDTETAEPTIVNGLPAENVGARFTRKRRGQGAKLPSHRPSSPIPDEHEGYSAQDSQDVSEAARTSDSETPTPSTEASSDLETVEPSQRPYAEAADTADTPSSDRELASGPPPSATTEAAPAHFHDEPGSPEVGEDGEHGGGVAQRHQTDSTETEVGAQAAATMARMRTGVTIYPSADLLRRIQKYQIRKRREAKAAKYENGRVVVDALNATGKTLVTTMQEREQPPEPDGLLTDYGPLQTTSFGPTVAWQFQMTLANLRRIDALVTEASDLLGREVKRSELIVAALDEHLPLEPRTGRRAR